MIEMTIDNDSATKPVFRMTRETRPRQVKGYRLATDDDLRELNKYADELANTALFYHQKLADGRIIYLAKRHNTIQALPVKFGAENFAHLTGMIFDHRTASQMLNDLADGKFTQNAILVKNDGTTFQKLSALSSFAKLIDAKTMRLDVNGRVPQARKLRFSKALKSSDKQLLLALRNFEPTVYRPFSLINLADSKHPYSDYSNVPENEVLAVLSLTRNQIKGFSIGTLSINSEYVKDGRQLMELTTKTRQILLKEYVAMQTRRKLATEQQNKAKKKGRER